MKKVNEIIEHYELIRPIGSGSFADVWLAKHQLINENIVIKIINKKLLKNKDFDPNHSHEEKYVNTNKDDELQINQKYVQEINMMKLTKPHPFIIQLFDFIETTNYYNIIMEYEANGNLAEQFSKYKDRLKTQKNKTEDKKNEDIIDFSDENEIKKIFVQIVRAAIYIHDTCQIAHRDLKAENIVFDENMNIKVIDFGLGCRINNCSNNVSESNNNDNSDHCKSSTRLILEDQSICGPPNYIPPEMILKNIPIGEEVDTWMLGVLLYFIVYGRYPYQNHDIKNLMSNIAYVDYNVPEKRMIIKEIVKTAKPNHSSDSSDDDDLDDVPNFLKYDMFMNFSQKKMKAKQQSSPLLMNNDYLFSDSDDEDDEKDTVKYQEVEVKVSSSLRDLIKMMLCKDPLKRISLKDVLKHPWIQEAKDFMNKDDFMNKEDEINTKSKKSTLERELAEKRRRKSKLAAKLTTKFVEISDSDLCVMEKISVKDVIESYYTNKEVPFDIDEVERQMKENVYNDNTAIMRILIKKEEKKQMKKLIDSFINEK